MMLSRKARWLTILPTLLLLSFGCCREERAVRRQWLNMGTIAALQLRTAVGAQKACDIVQETFAEVDNYYTIWHTNSVISGVNSAAGSGKVLTVTPECIDLLRQARRLSELSNGAFNPLVGSALRLWGFNSTAHTATRPDPLQLAAAMALADWRYVTLTDSTISLARPGMQLDLGAIAKGYAVDLAWQRLVAAGYTDLLVDLGGNLRAMGVAAKDRCGWRTGIRNPFDTTKLAGYFMLHSGEATATSGNYERFVEIDGRRYAHILDGRSGLPVSGMAGVTVVAPDATTADGLSTALFVLGPEQGVRLLRHYPDCDALWIPAEPVKPLLLATPGFAERLTPLDGFKVQTL